MVVRNAYSGSYDSLTSETLTIVGLTSETSTTNVTIIKELSEEFLNSFYETIIDAGYSDATKNEDDYSITVLGFKFYVVIIKSGYYYIVNIYTETMNSTISLSTNSVWMAETSKKDYDYNIVVRGSNNFINITCGAYKSTTSEKKIITIAKAKNLITNEEAYYFSGYEIDSSSSGAKYIRNKNHNYNVLKNISFSTYYTESGLNTVSKLVCEPQLAYNGTYLIYSMLRGNSAVLSPGKYYKIGNEIYYNDRNYLFKVE